MENEVLFQVVKQVLLQEGTYHPTVFCDTTRMNYVFPVLFMPETSHERQVLLFAMAREFSKSTYETVETIRDIHLVTEIWFTQHEINQYFSTGPVTLPSKDPTRKEALMLSTCRIQDKQLHRSINMAEILRTRDGTVHDLLPYASDSIVNIQDNLLTAFLAGIASTRWNDTDMYSAMKRFVEVGEF